MAMDTHSRVVYEREREPGYIPPAPTSASSTAPVTEPGREAAVGGWASAGFFGLVTVILAILGLVGVVPHFLVAIAGITAGVAFLAESGGTAAWFSQLTGRYGETMSSQAMGSIAAIILSILALIGLSSMVLLPVAILVLGASFLTGWSSAAGAKFLVGVASIVLGILALVGFTPLTLCLVAFLSLGCSALMSGGLFTGKMMRTQS